MNLLGIVTALLALTTVLGSATFLGIGVGQLLWPIWNAIAFVGPDAGELNQHSLWVAFVLYVLFVFGPACLVGWLFSLKAVSERLANWPDAVKLLYCWIAQFGFFSVCCWAVSGRSGADWLILAVLMCWLYPIALFWEQISCHERSHPLPPRWVGEPEEHNGRYRFFRGFRRALLTILGFACAGGWKEPQFTEAFGRQSAASAEEAGLL